MPDQVDRLKAALADRYRFEGELGGGGMSRVFVAEEIDLGRKVVIKVLPPDMGAGVNKERFQREIKLAASLQHPHVVPLLTAGADADLLYYVMPYIEGESLRAKLGREGELPVGEALQILREVADALAYAHDSRVVHRDIKPDNVMISRHHALVTDFGVAKAVSDSAGSTSSSITSLGVALGTPAYMSPEQAAADPHVDHRADIYALGALAYEMLTGRPPFDDGTPQQVLAAHVSRTPDPVTAHRDTIPEPVSQVIMRCLAKRAADRWQTAGELRTQFDGLATPQTGGVTPAATQPTEAVRHVPTGLGAVLNSPAKVAAAFGGAAGVTLGIVYLLMMAIGLPNWVFAGAVALLAAGLPIVLLTGKKEHERGSATASGIPVTTPVGLEKHFTWKKALVGGGLAFAGLTVVSGSYMIMRTVGIGPAATLMSTGVLGARELTILAEFDNRTNDSTLGSTVTELLRISLTESPVVRVADPARLSESLARMELSPDARIDEGVAREIAERESIKAIIGGEVVPLGDGYLVSARLVSATGDVLTAQQASASDASQLVAAVDELSAKLRERIGESLRTIRRTLPLELVTTGSLRALRLYAQATQAEIAGDDDRAVALLEEAVTEDSLFAMAHRKIGTILSNNFEQFDRARQAMTRAYELRDRLTELERGYAIAQYYTDVAGRREEALAAYRTILERYPDDHRALNNSGVIYFQLGDDARSRDFYQRALESDSTWSAGFSNLAFEQKNLGDFDEARATLNAMEERFPGNSRVEDARGVLAVAEADYDEAVRHWDNVLTAESGNLFWQADASENIAFAHAIRGRFRDGEQYMADALSALRQRDVSAQRPIVWWETRRFLATGGGEPVPQTIVDVATDDVMASLPVVDRWYEDLIMYYALRGDPDAAEGFLRDMEASGYADLGIDLQRDFDRSQGWAALAAGDVEGGLRHLRRGVDGFVCRPCGNFTMALAHDAAGNADSSRVYWEAYIDNNWGIPNLETVRPIAYRRLGEIYEGQGSIEKAVEYYNAFVELWDQADPDLQPQVADVRNRIAGLVGENR